MFTNKAGRRSVQNVTPFSPVWTNRVTSGQHKKTCKNKRKLHAPSCPHSAHQSFFKFHLVRRAAQINGKWVTRVRLAVNQEINQYPWFFYENPSLSLIIRLIIMIANDITDHAESYCNICNSSRRNPTKFPPEGDPPAKIRAPNPLLQTVNWLQHHTWASNGNPSRENWKVDFMMGSKNRRFVEFRVGTCNVLQLHTWNWNLMVFRGWKIVQDWAVNARFKPLSSA